jgi:hypothetical protein
MPKDGIVIAIYIMIYINGIKITSEFIVPISSFVALEGYWYKEYNIKLIEIINPVAFVHREYLLIFISANLTNVL